MSKTVVSIEQKVTEYDKLRAQSKTIKSQMDKLSAQIKDSAEKLGTKDDKGSYFYETDQYIFGKVAKKSVSFSEEKAIKFFKKKGLDKCIDIVEVINEEAVSGYVSSGDITYEELDDITQTKTTFAVDVKKKEEMPEIEQTRVPLVASAKPKLLFKSKG